MNNPFFIGTYILENIFSNRLMEKLTSNKFTPGNPQHEENRFLVATISIFLVTIITGIATRFFGEPSPLIKYLKIGFVFFMAYLFAVTLGAALLKSRTRPIYEAANKKLDEKRQKKLAAKSEKKLLAASEIARKEERRTNARRS